MSDTITARHAGAREAWISARARVNRGWLAMPRHAIGGRHAAPVNARGVRALAAVYGKAYAKAARVAHLTRGAVAS